jgi:4-hydroxy-tetrahydrodipicolinate synthase
VQGLVLVRFFGSIPAVLTPFDEHQALDLVAFRALLAHLIAQGSDALVIAGSTGESGALDETEYSALLATALDVADGRVPVIAGASAPATHKAVALAERARALGVQAILAATPYYSRPTQAGLEAHYRALADGAGLPVIVYNVPGRTGVDLRPDTVARLLDHPLIVGVKEAVPDPARMAEYLALRRPGFAVLSGDDGSALASALVGADGVISVAANVVPAAFAAMMRAAREGRVEQARDWDRRLQPVIDALGVEPNPIPVKYALARTGLIRNQLRLPLLPISAAAQRVVDHALDQFQATAALAA